MHMRPPGSIPLRAAALLATVLLTVPVVAPAVTRRAPVAATRSTAPAPDELGAASKDSALRHYLQGVYLEGSGDLAGAIQEVGRAFAHEPNAPDLALKLAELALEADDAQSGLDYARRSISLGEKSGRAQFVAGAAYAGAGRVDEARDAFTRSLAMDSTRTETWQALGRLEEEAGRLEPSRDAYAHSFALDPEDGETAYHLGMIEARLEHWGAADTLLAQAAETNPFVPGLGVARAFVAEHEGRIDEAAKGYEAHLEQFPNDRQTRRRLVQAYIRLEEWPRATKEARWLYQQSPRDFEAGRVLASLDLTQQQDDDAADVARSLRKNLPGEIEPAAFSVAVLLHVGREKEARSEADALTRERPEDARAWIVAAETWASDDKPGKLSAEADRRYARAAEKLADSTGARVELARSFTRTQRFDRAEQTLTGALEKDPKNARLWLELAFARERRKDVPGAEEAARKSLELDSKSGQALNFLGYLYADYQVKVDQAVPLIEQALALDPDNPYFIDSLGWAYYRLGRLEDARGQLERAVALGGGEAEVLEHLGDVYLALARRSDAKSQYQKALQLEPTSSSLARKLEALR
jgi:tetratricopeptide (TPR) repeat protein